MPTDDQHTEHFRFTEKCKELFDPNAPECCECGSRLWGAAMRFPLSRPATTSPSADVVDQNAPLCVGYSRLFLCVKDRKEKMDMINWIIAPERAETQPSTTDLKKLCKKRVASMKKRAHNHYKKMPDNFVKADELVERVLYDSYNCYLIGSPMCLPPGRFNSISFDHILPTSIAMMKNNCWSIENFQPVAHCINQVKGNETDKEARRWVINFKAYYCSPAFKA